MTEQDLRLVELAKTFIYINNEKLPLGLDAHGVVDYINGRALKIRAIMDENEKIINERILPLINNPETIDDTEYKNLSELAEALFLPNAHIDTDLSLRIHKGLVDRARIFNDTDGLIKQLYWFGLSLHYMDPRLFFKESVNAFTEASLYYTNYTEFENRETRSYINRSLGNVYVAYGSFKADGLEQYLMAIDTAYMFWTNPGIREFDPDMPWNAYLYSINMNLCTLLSEISESKVTDPELIEKVYQGARHAFKHMEEQFGKTFSYQANSRVFYWLYAGEYYTGRRSAQKTYLALKEIYDSAKDSDYSIETTYIKTHLAFHMLVFMGFSGEYTEEEMTEYNNKISMATLDYFSNLPPDISQFTANMLIGNFMAGICGAYGKEKYLDFVLSMTTFRHMPTYIHSLMVGWMTQEFTQYILEKYPEALIGINHTRSVEEVLSNAEDIAEIAYTCGLCHDVGKIGDINTISTCGRKLSDREFKLIQKHPETGFTQLRASNYNGVAEIARGHHKWYDGTRGYPEHYDNTKSEYKVMIDIVSVADTLDAATDTIGRTYAKGKSLAEVKDEIIKDAGTRYSPLIAGVLCEEEFFSKIETGLYEMRLKSYYTAYTKIYNKQYPILE